MNVRDARARYFETNGFDEAGYTARWAHFKIGPIPLAFPNTPSRQRALPMHDLHHVATGYPTTLLGEAEIGAWEVAGGCRNYWAAWVLDAAGFGYGVVFAPRRMYRAFVSGRRSKNLYHLGYTDELLGLDVTELRRRLQIDRPPVATWADRAAFAGWLALFAMPVVAAAAVAFALWR